MAAPSVNNVQAAAGTGATSSPWTLGSYNVPSGGSNKRLVVFIFAECGPGAYTLDGVTFGSDTLTRRDGLHQQGSYQTAEIWEKVNPTVQTANVTVSFTGTASLGRYAVVALYLTDADQDNSVDASDTDYNSSAQPTGLALTTTVDDCLLLAGWNHAGVTAWTAGTGFTDTWSEENLNSNSMGLLIETKDAGTAGAKSFDASNSAYQRATCAAIAVGPAGGGGATYALTCDTGAFTLTGITTGLKAGRKLAASVNATTLTGIATGLVASRKLSAETSATTLTGVAVGLSASRKLTASPATYTLAGVAASLAAARKLSAATQTFTLTGINAGLTYTPTGGPDYTLSCDAGAFTLTGVAVAIKASRKLTASVDALTLTGIDAGLSVGRKLTASAASFDLTGQAINLVVSRKILASAGSFTLTGINAGLTYSAQGYATLIKVQSAYISVPYATATIAVPRATATIE